MALRHRLLDAGLASVLALGAAALIWHNAHRLDYVLAGRYFFTQVMPGGVQFPYAIALYVFASPWAAFTRDHIALLRVVVAAAEAAAGLLLYWAILRTRFARK